MRFDDVNTENLNLFAYTNANLCKEIKGVVLYFHGLYETGLIREPDNYAKTFAERGILFVIPLYGPWAWMNRGAVKMIDRVIDVLYEKYRLPASTRIVSTGLSMGGLGALTFPRLSRHKDKIVAVTANCPVCDLIRLRDTRDDIPRTTYYAFSAYDMDMDDAVKTVSPVEHVNEMPRVPYLIMHCTDDTDVPKKDHSDVLVPKMLEAGHDVTYVVVHNATHCVLDDITFEGYVRFCEKHLGGKD